MITLSRWLHGNPRQQSCREESINLKLSGCFKPSRLNACIQVVQVLFKQQILFISFTALNHLITYSKPVYHQISLYKKNGKVQGRNGPLLSTIIKSSMSIEPDMLSQWNSGAKVKFIVRYQDYSLSEVDKICHAHKMHLTCVCADETCTVCPCRDQAWTPQDSWTAYNTVGLSHCEWFCQNEYNKVMVIGYCPW